MVAIHGAGATQATAEELLEKLRREDYLAKLVESRNESCVSEVAGLAITITGHRQVHRETSPMRMGKGVLTLEASDLQRFPSAKLKTFRSTAKMLYLNYLRRT